jgi:hypothetical protein
MLIKAQAAETQAARGFWGGLGKKSQKFLVPAGREQYCWQRAFRGSNREDKILY